MGTGRKPCRFGGLLERNYSVTSDLSLAVKRKSEKREADTHMVEGQ